MKLTIDSNDSYGLLISARSLLNDFISDINKEEPEAAWTTGTMMPKGITITDETPVVHAPPVTPQPIHPEDVAIEAGGTQPVERDNSGIQWDERIHSSSQKKTAAGSWKRRKNIEDSLYQSVLAELSTAAPTPTEVFEPAEPTRVQVPVKGEEQFNAYWRALINQGSTDELGSIVYIKAFKDWVNADYPQLVIPPMPAVVPPALTIAPTAVVPPTVTTAPAAVVTPPVVAPLTNTQDWGSVFKKCIDAVGAQTLTNDQLNNKAVELGVTGGFQAMGQRPDLFNQFLIELGL